jgi:CheY-like chemotaxis protein
MLTALHGHGARRRTKNAAMSSPSRLALIDDDRAWRETLAEYLERKGFTVYPAEDARRGLDLLENHDIRLALIDYQLGETDGLQLLRWLRQRARPLTAWLMSSEDDPSLATRAVAEGARAFLSKTSPPAIFLRTLLQMLTAAESPAYFPLVVHRTIWLPAVRPTRDPRRN